VNNNKGKTMKADIYIRTSTTEQTPEKQLKECKDMAEARGYIIDIIHTEQLSGYKQIDRPKYDLIKERARQGKINAVIVWALDRWVRNRDTLLEDVSVLKNYNVKLHSVKEGWLEAINIEGSLGKTIQDFLLGLIGSLAEMESKRKSDRMKMAYKNHSGNKWGRPSLKNVDNEIIKLNQEGNSMRKISKTIFYWDKNNNKKYVSIGYVHKILSKLNEENLSL